MRRKAIQKADEFRFRRERIVPVLFIIEVVFDGSYPAKASEGGLLGGAVQAVSFAALNWLLSVGETPILGRSLNGGSWPKMVKNALSLNGSFLTLSPPFARLCAPNYDLLRSYAFEPSLVRDSVGARPRHVTLRIAGASAIATMVGSIVLARAVGDKLAVRHPPGAVRQALRDQTASNSAGSSSGQNLNSTGAAWVSEPVIANIER
jgi:hypothetical protein